MGMRLNDGGYAGTQGAVKVPTVEAGELSKQEVKLGAAGRVLMPDGKIVTCGGELLRLALARGGKLITE